MVPDRQKTKLSKTVVAVSIVAGGTLLGYIIPPSGAVPPPYDRVSGVIGWIYFLCWSMSFYPQVILNYRRQSVVGYSFDFALLNLVGFVCYSIFNCAFYYSPHVQDEYAKRHDGKPNAVRSNDVFFAIHAAILTLVSITQCFFYDRGDQKLSKITIVGVIGIIFAAIGLYIKVLFSPSETISILNFLYFLGSVKLGITLVKYLPQVHLNRSTASTAGWPIGNVLLDFTGGVLSVAQLILDGYATNDWSAISGDPIKFGLGFASMFFDLIFMVQHYILYHPSKQPTQTEKVPLLPIST